MEGWLETWGSLCSLLPPFQAVGPARAPRRQNKGGLSSSTPLTHEDKSETVA